MGIDIYCLSFGGYKKREVVKRFGAQGLRVTVNPGVKLEDGRIAGRELHPHTAKNWSVLYGHLDMIRWFVYNGTEDYGIFCEDDVLIHKDFGRLLPWLESTMCGLNLDCLVLGYLCENPIDTYSNFPTIRSGNDIVPFKILEYPDNLWGSQMYMITRVQAGRLLDKYACGYADKTLKDTSLAHFCSDWTLTKEGRRALIYPMLAIEDGNCDYSDSGQRDSRQRCFQFAWRPGVYS